MLVSSILTKKLFLSGSSWPAGRETARSASSEDIIPAISSATLLKALSSGRPRMSSSLRPCVGPRATLSASICPSLAGASMDRSRLRRGICPVTRGDSSASSPVTSPSTGGDSLESPAGTIISSGTSSESPPIMTAPSDQESGIANESTSTKRKLVKRYSLIGDM